MGGAAIVGQVFGNATSAYEEAETAGLTAEQARLNSIRAEYAAKDAEARGSAEAATITTKGTQTIASARVATAASGIELDSPTALNVSSTTRAYSALDALMAKSNAAREAYGYRQQGKDYQIAQKVAQKQTELSPMALFSGHSGG
jgi:hypothetical protein